MIHAHSKHHIAPQITRVITQNLTPTDTFIDPFCRGCAVAEQLPKQLYRLQLSDADPYLIALFQATQRGFIPSPSPLPREEWEQTKQNPKREPHLTGYFGYLYGFRGQFFHGYCTIDNGINLYQKAVTSFMKTAQQLSEATFTHHHYRDTEIPDTPSLLYCDPPNLNQSKHHHIGYPHFNHEAFWRWLRDTITAHPNCKALVAEEHAPSDFIVIKSFTTNTEKLWIHKSQQHLWRYPKPAMSFIHTNAER